MTIPLNVVAIMKAKNGQEARLHQLLQGALPHFQQEPGCQAYALLNDLEDPTRFISYESWDDEAALEAHMKAPTMTKLKVDRTFVTNIHLDPASSKIVKSLIALCQDMQLGCIVEGVETAAELCALKNLGCTWAQGYLFSKPMRAGDISAWLEGEQLAKVQAV